MPTINRHFIPRIPCIIVISVNGCYYMRSCAKDIEAGFVVMAKFPDGVTLRATVWDNLTYKAIVLQIRSPNGIGGWHIVKVKA